MNEITRTERHIIRKNHIHYLKFEEITFASKNLYNLSNYYMRQVFIACDKIKNNILVNNEQTKFLEEINKKVNDYNKFKENNSKNKSKKIKKLNFFGADNKSIKYDFLNFLMKNTPEYKNLYAQISQQCLKLLEKNWKSFFNSIKDWKRNPAKYSGKPKLPKYLKKNGKNIIILTNQLVRYHGNELIFPKRIGNFKFKTQISGKFQQVRILPRNNSFVIEVIYRKQVPELKNNNKKYVGVDLGVNNLAALTNSENIYGVCFKQILFDIEILPNFKDELKKFGFETYNSFSELRKKFKIFLKKISEYNGNIISAEIILNDKLNLSTSLIIMAQDIKEMFPNIMKIAIKTSLTEFYLENSNISLVQKNENSKSCLMLNTEKEEIKYRDEEKNTSLKFLETLKSSAETFLVALEIAGFISNDKFNKMANLKLKNAED